MQQFGLDSHTTAKLPKHEASQQYQLFMSSSIIFIPFCHFLCLLLPLSLFAFHSTSCLTLLNQLSYSISVKKTTLKRFFFKFFYYNENLTVTTSVVHTNFNTAKFCKHQLCCCWTAILIQQILLSMVHCY